VAAVAATQLGHLGSACVLPDLVQALGSEHAALRTAAWTALQAITGCQLPIDDRGWLAFGAPDPG
jgi:hypothetical protein